MTTKAHARRIIVGVDGSEYSSNALKMAGRMAATFDAPLEVVTCVGMSDFYLAEHLDPGLEQYTGRLRDAAARLADEAVERAFGAAPPANVSVSVRVGSPARILVEESNDAQLLVIGRHGSGGFLSQPIGSVSRACAAHAHCPVLLVDQAPSENSHD
ncbi:universal stress protein [Arthrobacter sp. NyZ413]|uniref:universal stress protein n=1 Tax=Arthrobacter sp. NyZ413 TaxID=3144669 RepID=UPI003BF8E376